MRRHARVLFAVAALASFFAFATTASAAYDFIGTFANTGPENGSGSANGELATSSGKFDVNAAADVNDASGYLYVADPGNNRVQAFKPNATGGEYSFQAPVAEPIALAIDQASGDVYVATPSGVSKFDSALNPVSVGWSAPSATGALTVDPSTGDLLVADTEGNLVRRFSSTGTALGSFAVARPVDLAANSAGDVFVVTTTQKLNGLSVFAGCSASSAVQRFSASGTSKGTVGSSLLVPGAVAIDPDDDSIVIAAQVNGYFCEIYYPELAFFDSTGAFEERIELRGNAQYTMVPGLAAQGGGSLRVYAFTMSGLNWQYGATQIFALEDLQRPTVAIDPVADATITSTAAEFSGTVNPNGLATEWHFEYSADGGATWTPTSTQNAGAGTAPVAVSASVDGLQPATSYQVRLLATNSDGTKTSDAQGFTTDTAVKEVSAAAASAVTSTTATLNGTVNPGGIALTECKFEYGTDESFGQSVPCVESTGSIGSGEAPVSVHADVTGLQYEAPHYFRLVAANSIGATPSAQETFSTLTAVKAVSTAAATSLAPGKATFNGSINPGGLALSECKFEYGLDESLGQTAPCAESPGSIGSGEVPVSVHADVTGLDTDIYHFRLVATNAVGTTKGADETTGIPGAPVVLSQTAGPEVFRAVLKARINPANKATSYRFEYGTTTAYGQSTEEATIAAGNDPVQVVQEIKQLQPDTTYHYRVVAVNAVAETLGSDQIFATDVAPGSGSCPNAQIRAEQGADHLPECRAYEQISPQDKLGKGLFFAYPFGMNFTTAVAPDGSAATFQSQGAYADAASAFTIIDYVSRRGATGWSTHAITAKNYLGFLGGGQDGGGMAVASWSEDLSKVGVFTDDETDNPLAPGAGPSTRNLYLNDLSNNSFQALTLDQGPANPPLGHWESLAFAGGSTDLSTAVFEDVTPHTTNAPLEVTNPYAWHDGQLELVSILPDPDGAGSLIDGPAPQGASVGAGASSEAMGKNPVSDDGSRIVFTTPDGRLYMRENGATTVEIAASQKGVPDAQAAATFSMATPDGRYVFFSTEEALLDGDTNPGSDLYRYDVETGALVQISPNGAGGAMGVSDDGSYVYFKSGDTYLWHDGQVERVALGGDSSSLTAQVTPDGTAVAFEGSADQPLTGEDPFPGQATQILLYDAVADSLRCVSCRRDGGESTGKAWLPISRQGIRSGSSPSGVEPRAISDDGERVFFTSPDPLVAADVNERFDAYEYVNGRQYLLSGGTSNADSWLFNATPSGSDAYFISVDQLAPSDGDQATDLYTARIDGGFPYQRPPVSCTGEACKSGTTPPPPPTGAATPQFSGPGNANQRAAQKKSKKKKQKKKARNKKKAKKRASKSKGASKRSVGK